MSILSWPTQTFLLMREGGWLLQVCFIGERCSIKDELWVRLEFKNAWMNCESGDKRVFVKTIASCSNLYAKCSDSHCWRETGERQPKFYCALQGCPELPQGVAESAPGAHGTQLGRLLQTPIKRSDNPRGVQDLFQCCPLKTNQLVGLKSVENFDNFEVW